MMEERIINRLNVIAMGYHPIKVEMKDYGSFPSHTIYINITSKMPIQGLVKTIRTETQRLMKFDEDNKPHFILEPHVNHCLPVIALAIRKGMAGVQSQTFYRAVYCRQYVVTKAPSWRKEI